MLPLIFPETYLCLTYSCRVQQDHQTEASERVKSVRGGKSWRPDSEAWNAENEIIKDATDIHTSQFIRREGEWDEIHIEFLLKGRDTVSFIVSEKASCERTNQKAE